MVTLFAGTSGYEHGKSGGTLTVAKEREASSATKWGRRDHARTRRHAGALERARAERAELERAGR